MILKDGKLKKIGKRLDNHIGSLYGGPNYNGFSSGEAGFWVGFVGYMALIAGLFYLVLTYFIDMEN